MSNQEPNRTINDFLATLFEPDIAKGTLKPGRYELPVKPGQKLFANLEFPGLTTPYEVIEGNPLNDKCFEIFIREMDITRNADGLIMAVKPNPANHLIKAVKRENLFKSTFGLHRISPAPLAKDF